ncbi:MAG: TIM barrel protein [Kiritimatiellae bacterium]|nr:TIM barrel protein [Kiritimatiellia bacterium]
MSTTVSRLDFMKASLAGMAAVAVSGCATTSTAAPACVPKGACGEKKPIKFKFGLAGYTMHKKTLDETLAVLRKTDIHYLCVKDFHLPLKATDAEMAAFKEKCAKAGVNPYAAGPLYTKTNEDVRRFFEYAKRFGFKTVVGVPYDPADAKDSWNKRVGSRKQLEYIDKLVKEFDIRYAIHNHGPASPNMYPDVAYGWNLVKDLDPRIGFCMDVGWEYGCGKDPAETIRQYGSRIYDLHFKNFEKNKPNGASTPLPRGKINFVKVLKALRDIGYAGVCALEYERDFQDNIVPIAECVGYYRGLVDALED